ncbi:hypothetical protein BGZ82_011560 [Podila clonocystis]|nr:hypothetical protein BGZ82_011560 [Podila clonocystis]
MSNSTTPGQGIMPPPDVPTISLSLSTVLLVPVQEIRLEPRLEPASSPLTLLCLNPFFTSFAYESWFGINIYYHYCDVKLTSHQNYIKFITDLALIAKDHRYTTKTERVYADATLKEVNPSIFQEDFEIEEESVRRHMAMSLVDTRGELREHRENGRVLGEL